MTRLFLIRHATIPDAGRRLAGRIAGVHLDDRGRMQAQALATRFAEVPLAAIYSSPLERALETAEPMAKLLGLPVIAREEFQEIDFADWSGRAIDELAGDVEFQRFNCLRSCAPVPGGEFMLQAQARMISGLEALRARHQSDSVVVVSHGDMIKAAIAHYAGIPLDLFQRLQIGLASTSVVDIDDTTVRIVAVNDTGATSPGGEPC